MRQTAAWRISRLVFMDATFTHDVGSRLAERLEAIDERIARACERAGRERSSVTLVAVSKTYPVAHVEAAIAAGVRHFGESRVQELKPKTEVIPGRCLGGEIEWHMIGHIQRNKARDVVACADAIHSIDSLRIARELELRADAAGRTIDAFLQVNVSGEASKYGVEPDALDPLLTATGECPHLRIRGLMTLAAPADDPEEVRPQFRRLRSIRDEARQRHPHLGEMDALSMGMSGDFEVAIEEGATHVRIGSALFGQRDG